MTRAPRSPAELRDLLFGMFPAYRMHWEDEDNPFTSEDGSFTFHGLVLDFTEFFAGNLSALSERQLRDFGALINAAVAEDGPLENAVSTCFLEHLRQIKAAKVLKPFLSSVARAKSHA